jgi:hypothetical protein
MYGKNITWSYSTASAGARSGRVVKHFVHLLAQFIVFFGLGLLHPEKEDSVGGLELQDVDSASGALIHPFVFTIFRENDEVLYQNKYRLKIMKSLGSQVLKE